MLKAHYVTRDEPENATVGPAATLSKSRRECGSTYVAMTVTDDPESMRDLVHRYMEDETPDSELYVYVLSLGVEPPEEIRERD